jgi:hypothetical protein
MMQYGLISRVDSDTIEKTFEEIFKEFPNEVFNYAEIGLYNGRTTSGVKGFLKSKNKEYILTGIDNFKDKEELVFYPEDARLIQGSSIEVYNQLPDQSQHFILIDGNHSFPYVIADFFCYKNKIKVGGYICFHDAAPHGQDVSYQRMGSEDDKDMYISVLRALEAVDLPHYGFELAYHDWATPDIDAGGGVIVFKKVRA